MNKRLVWFTELFIWAVLILVLVIGFTYSFAKAEHKNHSYYMFFKDVDGLSQGSPVRMMGFQIGFVKEVKVFEDNIFVSFLISEKDVSIPIGSTARVEFYGLGGSKSLEIMPPEQERNKKGVVIYEKNPYRIYDYYNWSWKINSMLEVMATNASSNLDAVVKAGFNKPFLAKSSQKLNSVLQSFIKEEKNILDELNQKINSFNSKYKNINREEKDKQ